MTFITLLSGRQKKAATPAFVSLHVNRSSAGNGKIDVEFDVNITSSGGDYGLGFLLEMRQPSGTWRAIDSVNYSTSLQENKYIRFSPSGTVTTAQASHEFRVTYDAAIGDIKAAGGFALASFGPSSTLTNSSGVDLLASITGAWRFIDFLVDAVNASNLTNTNTVVQAVGGGELVAQFLDAPNHYLSVADNANIPTGNTDYTIATRATMKTLRSLMSGQGGLVTKDDAGEHGGAREWYLNWHRSDFVQFAGRKNDNSGYFVANSTITGIVDTYYDIRAGHNAGTDNVYVQVNDETLVETTTGGDAMKDSTQALEFGRFGNGRDHEGDIVRVHTWGKILTAAEWTDYRLGKEWPFNIDHALLHAQFTAANGTLLSAYTPDFDPLGATYADAGGTPEIQSNKAVKGNGVWDIDEATCVVSGVGDNTTAASIYGATGRYIDDDNKWVCYFNKASGDIEIWERTATTWTKRANVSHTGSSSDNFTVYFLSGEITGFFGSDYISFSSTTHNTSNNFGFATDAAGAGTVDDLIIKGIAS